jgi:hypothetical protein
MMVSLIVMLATCGPIPTAKAAPLKVPLDVCTNIHTINPYATATIPKKRAANQKKHGYDFKDAP